MSTKSSIAIHYSLCYNHGMDWNLIGHEWAVHLLSRHILNDSPRHAYLFTGAVGVGRRTFALRFAQALNCPQPPKPGQACYSCPTCRQIERMQHPDLAVVEADQIGGVLKVEQIRELQHSLSLSPYQSKYRLALLLRMEEAHNSAANALLKTLEEPPPSVILLLTANSVDALLPTVVSRCEVINLRTVPVDTLSQGLQERFGLSEEQSRLLAQISNGCPGVAIQYHLNPELLANRKVKLDELVDILKASYVERFNYAEKHAKERYNCLYTLQIWQSFWRDVLIQTCKASSPVSNIDRSAEINQFSKQVNIDQVLTILKAIQRTMRLIEQNINTRLAFETFMLDLPKL